MKRDLDSNCNILFIVSVLVLQNSQIPQLIKTLLHNNYINMSNKYRIVTTSSLYLFQHVLYVGPKV